MGAPAGHRGRIPALPDPRSEGRVGREVLWDPTGVAVVLLIGIPAGSSTSDLRDLRT
jgi:hypothetical protein